MIIYHYDPRTGCFTGQGVADESPLDNAVLLPVFSTNTTPHEHAERQCARYLTADGSVPVCHADGEWVVHPDWRDVMLWSTEDGHVVVITEPNVTPDERSATTAPYPGAGYVWRDGQWYADPALQEELAEQKAEQEFTLRQVEATSEINRIQPAVDGGYAKPADIELLPQWQRYRYELPDVREKEGWPELPQWPKKPGAVF